MLMFPIGRIRRRREGVGCRRGCLSMNFGRGYQTPRNGNGDSSVPLGRDDGIRLVRGPQGSISQESELVGGRKSDPRVIPVDDGIVCGPQLWTRVPMESEILGTRGSRTMTMERAIPPENGTMRNNDYQTFPQNDGTVESRNQWYPITPEKSIPQRLNTIPVGVQDSQMGNENWQDLIGIYTGLLTEETRDSNGVVLDFNPTPKPPTEQDSRKQGWIASAPKRDKNPSPYKNHSCNQASNSLSYFPTNGPMHRNNNLLETILGSKQGSHCVSHAKGAENTSVHVLGTPQPSMQVESRWVEHTPTDSMLKSPLIQAIFSNKLINHGYEKNQLPTEGFPVPYKTSYNLNSAPRSEPNAASSSFTSSFPFNSAKPDNQGKHVDKDQWVPEKVNFSVEELSTPAKYGHENQKGSIRSEDAENLYNELLQTIGGSPSSGISTTQKEHIVSEEGDEQGVNLNKTPQQKTPARRRKHRPKVIREGKPKRTPKSKDARNGASGETRVKRKYVRRKGMNISKTQLENGVDERTRIKRKYVRKKGMNVSESQQGNVVDERTPRGKRKYVRKKGVDNSESQEKSRVDDNAAPVVEIPAKTCKKQLNFDSEWIERDKSRDIRGDQQGINFNVNPQVERERKINSLQETSAMKIAQQNKYTCVPTNQESSLMNHTQAGNHYTALPENVQNRGHALNMLARNLSMRRNSVSGQDIWRDRYNRVNQPAHGERIGNVVFQAGVAPTNHGRASGPILQGTPQSLVSQNMLCSDERRGIKRQSTEKMHALLMYQKLLSGVEPGNSLASFFLENHKKTKTQKEYQSLVSSKTSNSRQEVRQMNGIYENSLAGIVNPAYKVMNSCGNVENRGFQPPMAATQNLRMHLMPSGLHPHTTRIVAERPERYTQNRGICSTNAMASWNPPPPTPPNDASKSAITTNQQSSATLRGRPRKQKFELTVDNISYKLGGLHIYDKNEKGQHAVVPYRGSNAVILFESAKKRKPRPKVDLDPETDRLWKLLMGKEGSEGTETLDTDKEKWWEDERRVFRGRADSFIARMHLVQGDRRFSRWKGSVVDSVIGVFLTQNVSDHLSSSAFMALAAKFPVKSKNKGTCCKDGTCVPIEEHVEVIEPSDIMKRHENIRRQPAFNRISEEEVILSQDSFNSSTVQTVDEIRSSSGSNFEAEDQTTTSKQSGSPASLIQLEKPSMCKENFGHGNWRALLDEQGTNMHHLTKDPECNIQIPRMNRVDNLNGPPTFTPSDSAIRLEKESPSSTSHFRKDGSLTSGMIEEESTSSLFSSNSGMTQAYHTSNVTYQQNKMPTFQAPSLGRCDFLSDHPTGRENFQPGARIDYSQRSNSNHQQMRDLFMEHAETPATGKTGSQKEGSAVFRGTDTNVEDRVSVVDKQNCLENTASEANSKERNYASHEPPSGASINMSKERTGTSEDEKKGALDWDGLRKQVLSNGEKRERSKDAMDSLDYEALRCAHDKEISDTIRERGMNNLLADRMKDFLNRLVRDHGSIDLEWLRDAPPDKAKNYLLSIRGLGLKSVECVRLLTLHHLAFPVDTNVGRIAVRLGWVPLQPLPESLQLHLLEMYPVLESIQKYLWPRLCKLDQLTLYELHYQMITFGKVFCTKSKPNCNACPMRAECRHFASAFASARLALPGPEKRIVTSDAPIARDPAPTVVSRPMPLPAAEKYNKNTGFFGIECEPIIEEPATPEPETTELSISDIEDQYYEDSDDIPSIKLNMEEFTTNLQSIMQDSNELHDDMSKALVALNPKAASIPTAKLKNVSRLRTEHQVYELPDSHPLLESLDKREPDDPSPYLLAIWSPGETANSVQPPERGCPAQESGKLCDQTTCFSCNSMKEANSQVVRGTILIPCRTAMRGSFPLNGTYFQVNEMFADHASSLNPIDVPRTWIWNLPRRTVFFGTSVSTIFKGLTTEGIQYCFWRGFVCVRGFDQKTRAPRPLMARLHFPASKIVKTKNEG